MTDHKILDTKISLMWLIGIAGITISFLCGLSWNGALMSNKIDQMLLWQEKADKRQDNRDGQIDHLRTVISDIQRTDDKQDLRIDSLERIARMQITGGRK